MLYALFSFVHFLKPGSNCLLSPPHAGKITTVSTNTEIKHSRYSTFTMSSSTRPGGRRLPISCQACRLRKIRCSRDGRPCQTCVRRGLGAEDCVYLGQPRLSSDQTSSGDALSRNELLARIHNLENLLQKARLNSQYAPQSNDSFSPQTTASAAGSSSSESDSAIGLGPMDSTGPIMGDIGSLQTFATGYVRYLPLASQWNSVVTKSSTGDCLQNINTEIPDDEDDLQIPLVKNGSISRNELLGLLPPGRYCDTLKDVYFRVFSPVCHFTSCLTLARANEKSYSIFSMI